MSRLKVFCTISKHYSTKPKLIPDENVLNAINNSVYKPRNHPGVLKPRVVSLPNSFIAAVQHVTADHSVKRILEDGKVLHNHLQFKRPPVEDNEMKELTSRAQQKVLSKLKKVPQIETEADQIQFEDVLNQRLAVTLRGVVYNWQPVNYDNYKVLVYLMIRAAPEYAALIKIFTEIAGKDQNFKPRSFFDFGSGVGTASWYVFENFINQNENLGLYKLSLFCLFLVFETITKRFSNSYNFLFL